MARVATEKSTKAASKTANTKTAKTKEDKPTKAKRAPSAYNVFMGENLKKWREEHPGTAVKEAMVAVAAMWRESPDNPKRGQTPAARKPKADKENTKTKAKPKSKKKAASDEDEEEEDEEEDAASEKSD